MKYFERPALYFLLACLQVSVALGQQQSSISSLRFLDEFIVPNQQKFEGTTLGGFSGIDKASEKDEFYIISDDRSAMSPARFYRARIRISNNHIDTVEFLACTFLRQADGSVYPGAKVNPRLTPDPEAIRYDRTRDQLVWCSEGERIMNAKDTVLVGPGVFLMSKEGLSIGNYVTPQGAQMQRTESGARRNGTFEGLSFSLDFKSIFVSLEEPLFEDGPRADVKETKSFIRIYEYDVASKKNTRQYAYKLEAVAYPPIPETAFKVNGIPDILAIDENQLLVIERSFSMGRLPCTIKVFIADLHDAQNVASTSSLTISQPIAPAKKRLVINMDTLGIYTDNIEGVTWGPDLPNGHRSLLFVSDNNFELFQRTQFLLFEVIP